MILCSNNLRCFSVSVCARVGRGSNVQSFFLYCFVSQWRDGASKSVEEGHQEMLPVGFSEACLAPSVDFDESVAAVPGSTSLEDS